MTDLSQGVQIVPGLAWATELSHSCQSSVLADMPVEVLLAWTTNNLGPWRVDRSAGIF